MLGFIAYKIAQILEGRQVQFNVLVAAAAIRAKKDNDEDLQRLRIAFPEVVKNVEKRHLALEGLLLEDNLEDKRDIDRGIKIAQNFIDQLSSKD